MFFLQFFSARGFGIRVVGGCSSTQNPGHLRSRGARVTAGSGADFAGIRRGDVVLSWNGIRLTNLTFEETCKVMDASGDSVELTIASFDKLVLAFLYLTFTTYVVFFIILLVYLLNSRKTFP